MHACMYGGRKQISFTLQIFAQYKLMNIFGLKLKYTEFLHSAHNCTQGQIVHRTAQTLNFRAEYKNITKMLLKLSVHCQISYFKAR